MKFKALLACVGVSYLTSTIAASTGVIQHPPADSGGANMVQMEAQLAAFSLRASQLEARLKVLEVQASGANGTTVKAPFVVMEGGTEIMRVENGVLRVKGKSDRFAAMGDTGFGLGFVAQNSSNNDLKLVLKEDKALLNLSNNYGDFAAIVENSRAGFGVLSKSKNEQAKNEIGGGKSYSEYSVGGKPIALLGHNAQKSTSSLEIYNAGGERVAAIGNNAENRGTVALGESQSSVAATLAATSKGGQMVVYKGGGNVPSAEVTADPGQFAVMNDGGDTAVAFLQRKENGGGSLGVGSPAGEYKFRASYTGQDGEACVIRKGDKLHCLGIAMPGMP